MSPPRFLSIARSFLEASGRAGIALAMISCAGANDELSSLRASMEHGVEAGQSFNLTAACTNEDRYVPVPPAAAKVQGTGHQVVVAATHADCALCALHLEQMTDIIARISGDADVILLLWAPNEDIAMRSLKTLPIGQMVEVCLAKDDFWVREDITHTPFTLLIENGRVVAVVDGEVENSGAGTVIQRWATHDHSRSGG